MASKRQTTANRRNAGYSTGPRTEDGRQASSLNALKHGLRSQLTVIPGENEADFHALFDAFAEEAAPESPRDLAAVRKIAVCEWRLRRIAAIETEMFTQALQAPPEESGDDNIEAVVQRRAAQQAAPPPSPLATLATRFLKGEIKHFGALTRYEASLNRQYNQAWRDLDSRPEPVEDFRGVYDPDEPEPPYTWPTPDALVWKSATERYAEAEHLDPNQTPIDPMPSEPAPQTAQSNPIPNPDTPPAPSVIPFPPVKDVRAVTEWALDRMKQAEQSQREENDHPLGEENILNPGA